MLDSRADAYVKKNKKGLQDGEREQSLCKRTKDTFLVHRVLVPAEQSSWQRRSPSAAQSVLYPIVFNNNDVGECQTAQLW